MFASLPLCTSHNPFGPQFSLDFSEQISVRYEKVEIQKGHMTCLGPYSGHVVEKRFSLVDLTTNQGLSAMMYGRLGCKFQCWFQIIVRSQGTCLSGFV